MTRKDFVFWTLVFCLVFFSLALLYAGFGFYEAHGNVVLMAAFLHSPLFIVACLFMAVALGCFLAILVILGSIKSFRDCLFDHDNFKWE